jgi:hypothetical protein
MTRFDRSERARWHYTIWRLTLPPVTQVLSFTTRKHRNTVRFQILIIRARVGSLTRRKTKTSAETPARAVSGASCMQGTGNAILS